MVQTRKSAGRGSPFPEWRRRSTIQSSGRLVLPTIGRGSLPLQTPWLTRSFTSQQQGLGHDWPLSPTGTSNRPAVVGCGCGCGYELIGRSPQALTGVSARGLDNWRSTPGQPEEREKRRQNRRRSPSNTHKPFHRRTLLCCTTGMSAVAGDN